LQFTVKFSSQSFGRIRYAQGVTVRCAQGVPVLLAEANSQPGGRLPRRQKTAARSDNFILVKTLSVEGRTLFI
jgi:hypothetical protein